MEWLKKYLLPRHNWNKGKDEFNSNEGFICWLYELQNSTLLLDFKGIEIGEF